MGTAEKIGRYYRQIKKNLPCKLIQGKINQNEKIHKREDRVFVLEMSMGLRKHYAYCSVKNFHVKLYRSKSMPETHKKE